MYASRAFRALRASSGHEMVLRLNSAGSAAATRG